MPFIRGRFVGPVGPISAGLQGPAFQQSFNRAISRLAGRGGAGRAGSLSASFQKALDEANRANRARQAEIEKLLAGLGEQERKDIEQQFTELGTQAGQELIGRGLTGTTVPAGVQAGIQTQKSSALGRLRDRLARERAGFLERIEETGPDFGLLAQLAQLQGRGGGATFRLGGRRGRGRLAERNREIRDRRRLGRAAGDVFAADVFDIAAGAEGIQGAQAAPDGADLFATDPLGLFSGDFLGFGEAAGAAADIRPRATPAGTDLFATDPLGLFSGDFLGFGEAAGSVTGIRPRATRRRRLNRAVGATAGAAVQTPNLLGSFPTGLF